MITFVGTQDTFVDALKELVELDYAVVDAYETAIERLDNPMYRDKLKEFKENHERHIRELSSLLQKNNSEIPEKKLIGKQLLTTGKVLIANMVGDNTILHAMKSNELDTNAAYKGMCERTDKWPDSEDILKRGLQDEIRHKAWLESVVL